MAVEGAGSAVPAMAKTAMISPNTLNQGTGLGTSPRSLQAITITSSDGNHGRVSILWRAFGAGRGKGCIY